MLNSQSRPKRGLPLEQAFARWSDAAAYKQLVELSGADPPVTIAISYERFSDHQRRKEYVGKRNALEAAFKQQLLDGSLLVSAIMNGMTAREIIDPELWDHLMDIDFDLEQLVRDYGQYQRPEFFERSAIPLNIRSIPAWLNADISEAPPKKFAHDESYQHVSLCDAKFTLGPLCAKIIKILHEAALAGDPWCRGTDVLEQAGSAQLKLGDVFKSVKSWQTLIESDGRGMYRLRLD